MKVLISERLSEHKYKTPEGYLICTDAILARTGKQRYTKDELFGDGDSEEVDVDRPYEQVMNEKTISSFENKPVTFDHPDEDVNVGNYKEYAVGYVRDVHQGKVNGRDVILGNLVITDQDAIDAIENGEHTDLSCGYDCDIKDDGHGSYYQNNIRGNHVALCREGRAGNARIVDSRIEDDTHTYYSTIRNQKFKIKGLPNHRIKMIYEDGKEEEKKESYFKELLQKQIIRIVDSKINDAAIGGHYKNSRGENFFICSYGSGFSIFKADGEYLDGSRHLSLDGVKQRILSYNLTKVKDSVDSKADDADKYSYRLAKTKNDYDEYVVKAYKNGKYYEEASYYTDDWQDALDTLKMMAKREGLNFRQEGSRYIADSVNDAFNNGKLKDFRIEDLIRLVKERKEAVNSIRLDDKGNIYYIVVDGSLDTDLNTGKNASLDVVCEDKESHHQKRCIMLSRASSWKEIIATFNRWRDTIRDSVEDSNIVDALSASEKDLCDYILENCREEDEDENDLLKKMKLYYSKYSSLARSKPNEVLNYFREHIDNFEDSIKDSSNLSTSKALKMTVTDALKILNIVKSVKAKDEYLGMVYINGRPMYIIHKKEPGMPEFWGITPSKWGDNPRKKFKSKKELDDYLTSVNAVSK